MERVTNMLAQIDLTDPNAKLESAFGPPVKVASPIPGQEPTIVRYGSQARNVLHQQPIEVPSEKSAYSANSASVSPSPVYAQTPQFAQYDSMSPPSYESTLPSYESIPTIPNEKSQYDIKKINAKFAKLA